MVFQWDQDLEEKPTDLQKQSYNLASEHRFKLNWTTSQHKQSEGTFFRSSKNMQDGIWKTNKPLCSDKINKRTFKKREIILLKIFLVSMGRL